MCFDHAFLTLALYRSKIIFSARVIDIFLLGGEYAIFELIFMMLRVCEYDILMIKDQLEMFNYLNKNLVENSFKKRPNLLNDVIVKMSLTS